MPRRPAATPALPLDRTLTYRLHQLHKWSDRVSADTYATECGLALGEARCLAAIGAFAPLSVVDLAQYANLDKGQASRAAQVLVDRGWVAKASSEADGRGVLLSLTPSGRPLHRRVMALIERRNQEIFGALSADEQTLLGELFDRLLAAQTPQGRRRRA